MSTTRTTKPSAPESVNCVTTTRASRRHHLGMLGLLVLCGLLSACAGSYVLRSGFQPHAAPNSPLATVAPLRVAFLSPTDLRIGLAEIGRFDPNNLEMFVPFKTEKPEEQEVQADLSKLLAAVGIAIDPAAPVKLRLALRHYQASGRRSFDSTTFSTAIAFDLNVYGSVSDESLYLGSYRGRADARGTDGGAQDTYFNTALTLAIDRAMREVAADPGLAEALLQAAAETRLDPLL
ncbi:MAG: hypothetical protein ACI8TX_003934 [Hyphomicrobiaceae bacterium]|jgi:hypothetical protein